MSTRESSTSESNTQAACDFGGSQDLSPTQSQEHSESLWSQPNILWVGMSAVWWLGSLVSWMVAYLQPEMAAANRLLLEENSLSGSSALATGILIVLISATLRLPAITVSAGTSPQQNLLVGLLGAGANVNWLGMLCLRSELLGYVLLPIGLAVAVEYSLWFLGRRGGTMIWPDWSQLFQSKGSADSPQVRAADTAQWRSKDASVDCSAPSNDISSIEEPTDQARRSGQADGERLSRTMMDQIDADGQRLLTGEIFLDWQQGQKSQILVVGFVPAFTSIPFVELEAECSQTTVRCLNCTQSGLRVELKRSGSLQATESVLAWCARQPPDLGPMPEQLPSDATSSQGTGLP